jgi:hypothetical protein
MMCHGDMDRRDAFGIVNMRDASVVRLSGVSENLLVREIFRKKDGSPEGLYSREGDS